jgi:hypothetical protein
MLVSKAKVLCAGKDDVVQQDVLSFTLVRRDSDATLLS